MSGAADERDRRAARRPVARRARAGLPAAVALAVLLATLAARPDARAAEGDVRAAALPDSLLEAAAGFDALRPTLLTLTTARVAATAWDLVPRLVTLDRPDLLVDFIGFWEDRCGRSEPLTRTRLLAAIWDGAFDEGLYDETVVTDLDAWLQRNPDFHSDGRRAFDAFMIAFADQLLPHQEEGSLPEYFCLLYSDRADQAADVLAGAPLAASWLRWYIDHPDGADGGEIVPAEEADAGARPADVGPSSLLLTTGTWQPRGDVRLAGSHVLLGGIIEQELGDWFVRVPLEVRLGRTDRPYLVDQDGVRARSDRFDAVYLGLEGGRPLLRGPRLRLDGFAGLGYDGIRPFLKQDVQLATLNASLGIGLRWLPSARPWLVGLDVRREWLGARNDGPDPLGGGAWSLRLGAGLRLGRAAAGGASR